MRSAHRPVNVFELSGFPRWETVASRVLAYFLDPRDPRHRLGSAGVDALLTLLNGATTLPLSGKEPMALTADQLRGSREWTVETESPTSEGKRIDILLTNDEHDLAIAIENKLDAAVNNPFESYARRAGRDQSNVVTVLLAPTHRTLPNHDPRWVSAQLTYDEFFAHFVRRIEDVTDPDPRSLDLLRQFIENTSEKEQRVNASADADMLEQFWAATAGRGSGLGEFFEALTRVNTVLRRRAKLLDTIIQGELQARGLLNDAWMVAGNDRAWGRSDGRVAIVYVAYELTSGNCVELMVGQHPAQDWTGFAIKAYPNRRKPGAMYGDFTHRPLRSRWRDPDSDIASEFIRSVEDLERRYPRGV